MNEKKDIFSLISFASIGNLIPIISLPFLVKLYSPEQFGQVTLYTVFLIIFSNILSLKYDQAILVSKNKDETITLFLSSLTLTIFSSISILTLVLLSSLFLNFSLDNIFLIFFGIIFQFLTSTIFIYHNRNMNISFMNLSKTLPLILYVLVAFTLPFFNLDLNQPLVYTRLISLFISSIVLIFGIYSDFSNYSFSLEKSKKVLQEYINYPKNILPSKALNMISKNSIDIFISILFGNAILGIFSISRRIVSIPEMVISRPLETYFRRKVFTNNSLNTKKLKTTFFKYFKNISISSLFVYLSLVFIAPEILPYIFTGKEWGDIIPVVTVLSLGYTVSFVVVPFMSVFRILKIEKYEMIFQTVFFFAISILFTSVIVFDLKYNYFLELFNLQRIIVFVFCIILILKLILKKEYERV
jgi:O-antigen/teichoic acid export membrane protein